MKTIQCRNVNDALSKGIQLIKHYGEFNKSRNGNTLEIPSPVATTYTRPWERVLLNSQRDANPFFHLMESLWILAGREDVGFLTEFNKRMGDYSDDGEVFNAPYGFRLKNWYIDPEDVGGQSIDQLEEVIFILNDDPDSRQAVCQIWDVKDILKQTKDKACNMSIVFRIRKGKLTMTVYNRSNDMIWGAYGANVVQFSMIQEYVAARLGLPMGDYTQISNAFHVYTTGAGGELWDKLKDNYTHILDTNPYDSTNNLVRMDHLDMRNFDIDLEIFFNGYDNYGLEFISNTVNCYQSVYFKSLVLPMLKVYLVYKEFGKKIAATYTSGIVADDWAIACEIWLSNRKEQS